MKKFALLVLVLLLFASPLYSKPKLEISLSNIHPVYPECISGVKSRHLTIPNN